MIYKVIIRYNVETEQQVKNSNGSGFRIIKASNGMHEWRLHDEYPLTHMHQEFARFY